MSCSASVRLVTNTRACSFQNLPTPHGYEKKIPPLPPNPWQTEQCFLSKRRSSQLGEHFRKDSFRPWLPWEAPRPASTARCQWLISLPEGGARARPGPRSPRWEAGSIGGHELNLPRAAQEGPAVPGCPEHLLERTKGLFCHQESIQSAIECPVCAWPQQGLWSWGKKKTPLKTEKESSWGDDPGCVPQVQWWLKQYSLAAVSLWRKITTKWKTYFPF